MHRYLNFNFKGRNDEGNCDFYENLKKGALPSWIRW